MGIRLAAHSLQRVAHALRRGTRRSQGRSLEEICDDLLPDVRGWVNYFALADAKAHMQRLDEWLRRRMRQIAWKQWKTPANRYRNLRALGVSEFWAIRVGGSSKGPWRLSSSPPVQRALNNAYWHEFGLPSFLQLYKLRHT